LDENDSRRNMSRFQPENFAHNLELVNAISEIAQRKGVTPAQLAIAWVSHLGPHVVPLPGSSKKERTLENLAGIDVVLTADDSAEIEKVLESFEPKGGRYNDKMAPHLHLWG
jgi:pyridoxine 4-dehydrogenase